MVESLFVVFEGGDGAGKTTQSDMLADRLRRRGREVVQTFEPGATDVGRALRDILLDVDSKIDPWAEVLMYASDRAQHVAEMIVPALESGSDVISDRYIWSSLAYQGAARGLGIDAVAEVNARAVSATAKPIVILLDIAPGAGLDRSTGRHDRIESEAAEFHVAVRDAFIELANSANVSVVDASLPREQVADFVWSTVVSKANERGVAL